MGSSHNRFQKGSKSLYRLVCLAPLKTMRRIKVASCKVATPFWSYSPKRVRPRRESDRAEIVPPGGVKEHVSGYLESIGPPPPTHTHTFYGPTYEELSLFIVTTSV